MGDFGSLTPETILSRIREASAVINRLTGQWFQPVGVTVRVSGMGDSMLHFPGYPPLLRVEGLDLSSNGSGSVTSLENYFIETDRRILRLRHVVSGWLPDGDPFYEIESSRFPRRAGSVELRGYFGHITPVNSTDAYNNVVPFTTTTEGEIREDSTNVVLASVNGVRPGTSLLLGSALDDLVPLFVVGIDRSSRTVTFDALGDFLPETLAAGTAVKVFGAVPTMLGRAAAILASNYLATSQASGGSGGTGVSDAAVARRLIMEKTEDYTYRLDSPIGGRDTSDSAFTSGDAEVDNILASFVPPPGIEFV
jgi:hypothetical protein